MAMWASYLLKHHICVFNVSSPHLLRGENRSSQGFRGVAAIVMPFTIATAQQQWSKLVYKFDTDRTMIGWLF